MTGWILDKSAHARLVAGAALPDDIDAATLAVCDMGVLHMDRAYGRIAEVRPHLTQRSL